MIKREGEYNKKEKEAEIRMKKEVATRNKELAKLVKKEGPEKLLSLEGISSLGSSMPSIAASLISQMSLFAPTLPSQTMYIILCSQLDDAESGVQIINDSSSGILDLFDDMTKGDEPEIWIRIKS